MKALILAAGQGTRLRDIAPSKPLAPVLGTPLIERVIGAAVRGGAAEFVVVTGYLAEPLEAFLAALAERTGLTIKTVRNPDWRQANGLSVVAAEALLDGAYLLMMADHLFEPAVVGDLLAAGLGRGALTLAVDRRLDNPLVDLQDVTRVRTGAENQIVQIGKLIEAYDAFDTGVFLATPALPEAIRQEIQAGGGAGLSAGVQRLARSGLAGTHDIGERFWLDVDDAVAFGHAEAQEARAASRS